MASSSAAQSSLGSTPVLLAAVRLQALRRLERRPGPEVAHGPLEGVGRLVELGGIPLVDRSTDLRHPLRAFAEEEPRELLQQLRVPIHALQGRGHVESGVLGLRPRPARAPASSAAVTRPSRTSKSSWGRSGLET